MDSFCVWWLSKLDFDLLGSDRPAGLPAYIDNACLKPFRHPGIAFWNLIGIGAGTVTDGGEKSLWKLVNNLNCVGIIMWRRDIPTLQKNVGFVTTLACMPIDSSPPGVLLYFSEKYSRNALLHQFWTLIFGEFEVTERGDWKMDPFQDGMGIRIYHPDLEKLIGLIEAFHDRRYSTWSDQRAQAAATAVERTFTFL